MKHAAYVGLLGLLLSAPPILARDAGLDKLLDLAELEARLVVNKDTYVLNPAQRGEAFRKRLKDQTASTQINDAQGIVIQGNGIQGQAIIQAQVIIQGNAQGPKKEEKARSPKNEKKPQDSQGEKKNAEERRDAKKKTAKDAKDQEKPQNVQTQTIQIQVNGQGVQIIQGNPQRIQIQGGIGAPQAKIVVLGGQPQRPLPPAVDMVLEIHNVSGRELTIPVGGDDSEISLKLQGPGAVTVGSQSAAEQLPLRAGKQVKIAAGQTHKIPITRLQHGYRNQAGSYWTEPGEYTLSATYKTTLQSPCGSGTRPVSVTTPPAKIKVVEPK